MAHLVASEVSAGGIRVGARRTRARVGAAYAASRWGAWARIVACAWLALGCPLVHAWQAGSSGLTPIPELRDRVTDLTRTLSPQASQALVAKLAAWETKTGNQLVVLIVPSTQPESIEAYGIRVAEAWKIGRKGHDNGALLIVAKDDRKLRIEVGYGLEGTLTDAVSRRIVSDVIAPQFRSNQFDQGITAGVDAIIATVDKDPGAVIPAPASAARDWGHVPVILLFIVFVIVPAAGRVLRQMFGTVAGTTLGSGLAGIGTWFVLGSVFFGIVAAVLALIVLLIGAAMGSGVARGTWTSSGGRSRDSGWGGGGWGGGGWSGGGGGGGGFSGGGGSFGGGGASGSW